MRKIFGVVLVSLFALVSVSFASQQENQWSKFNVGSWVLYDLGNGMQQKQTLVDKSAIDITVKTEMVIAGNTIPGAEIKIPLDAAAQTGAKAEAQPKVKETSGSIEIKGKVASCKIYEVTTDQGVSKSWVAENIPGGVVQIIINDKVTMKLVDYELK